MDTMNNPVITDIVPKGEGECVLIKVKDGTQELNFVISSLHYINERFAENESLSEKRFSMLEYYSKLFYAQKKAILLLSYGEKTKMQLVAALMRKGIERDIAKNAVDILEEERYINEEELAYNYALSLANKRYWGKKRINAALCSKCFDRNTISTAIERISDNVDYMENLMKIMSKKGYDEYFAKNGVSSVDSQKIIKRLLAYGYSFDEIREAISNINI